MYMYAYTFFLVSTQHFTRMPLIFRVAHRMISKVNIK